MCIKTNSAAEFVTISFRETVRCSKPLCGHFNMVLQERTAVEHLSRVTASKSSLIITDHLENNWAVHRPLDRGRQTRETQREGKRYNE